MQRIPTNDDGHEDELNSSTELQKRVLNRFSQKLCEEQQQLQASEIDYKVLDYAQ